MGDFIKLFECPKAPKHFSNFRPFFANIWSPFLSVQLPKRDIFFLQHRVTLPFGTRLNLSQGRSLSVCKFSVSAFLFLLSVCKFSVSAFLFLLFRFYLSVSAFLFLLSGEKLQNH